jgi:N4-gp56 family major capsid protein
MPTYTPDGTAAVAGGGLASTMQVYYDKVFLERLENVRKYDFLAVPKSIPKNSGEVVYFTRFNQMTANATALTDGADVTGVNTSASTVIATAKPYGAFEVVGRLFELTTIDAGLKEHAEVMGQNAGETMDIVLGKELNSAATALCGGATFTAQASAIASSDTLSVSSIRKAVSVLKKNKAPKWENGNYRAVIDVDGIYQLQGDTSAGNWVNIGLYNSKENADMLKKGVIGSLYGVDIVETNQAFSASGVIGTAAPSARSAFIAGKGAVAEVKVGGNGDARIIYNPATSGGVANPLQMYSTIGWKVDAYAAKVLNADWVLNMHHYGEGTAN